MPRATVQACKREVTRLRAALISGSKVLKSDFRGTRDVWAEMLIAATIVPVWS